MAQIMEADLPDNLPPFLAPDVGMLALYSVPSQKVLQLRVEER